MATIDRKALLAGAAAAALGVVLAGPVSAQELRIGVQQLHNEFDPGDETGNDGAPVLYNVFDTLIERDPHAVPLEFRPGLATAWEMIKPTVMELKLREGVVMHDNTTMDAEDVAYSLNRIFNQERPEFMSADGRFFYNFEKVEVVDPMTVRIHAERPDPLFKTLLSARNAGIVSKEYHEEVGFKKGNLMPMGSGPYRVVEFTPEEIAVLERHDDFWGDPPPFERLTFRNIGDVSARVTALLNDEVDLITNLPPTEETALADAPGIDVKGITWPMFHVWVLNMNDPVLKDARIRKALRLAVDREALNQGLWNGKAGVPDAHQYKQYGDFYDPERNLIRHDPEEARALLKAAGYDNEPIKISFMERYYLYGKEAAQAIADMWEQVGVNVVLEQVEGFDYDDIMIRAWSNPMYYPDPMGAIDTHWSERSWTAERGWWDPQNPEWDAVYETVRFSTDHQERVAAYDELLRMAEEESGWILLYRPHEAYAMREDLEWEIPAALRPYTLPLRAGQAQLAGE